MVFSLVLILHDLLLVTAILEFEFKELFTFLSIHLLALSEVGDFNNQLLLV